VRHHTNDPGLTFDGERIRAAVVRHFLRVTLDSPAAAAALAQDLGARGIAADLSGCVVCVRGSLATLARVESLLTK
jgi:sulfur transfer complex TusBCD TusB component (DsrH family)